jgi:biopolymer transport protein ExbB
VNAQPLWQLLASAGWTMAPLYACSVLALTLILFLAFVDLRDGVGRRALLHELEPALARGDLDEVHRLARRDRSPLGPVVAAAVEHARASVGLAEAEARRRAQLTLERYSRGLPWLAVLAQVAPLFGLLGTVIGMVELFSSMELAGAAVSTQHLSGGIWKALLTTAAGLLIAIPTVAAHVWFSRRLARLQTTLEHGAGRVLDHLRLAGDEGP